jgi:hypothetical protein
VAKLLRRGTIGGPEGEPGEERGQPTLRERGALTVHELADVGRQLYPLQQKRATGAALFEDEQTLYAQLETRYRELEGELRHLMRPRERDPWLRGADHTHGPDDSR